MRSSKFLRINTSNNQFSYEVPSDDFLILGGRALTSELTIREVDPLCDPVGPNNKLFFAPGTLGGTGAPTSGRLSIGTKSPLTGGIKESNGGGTAALNLAKLSIKALILEGQGDKWQSIIVKKDAVEFIPADDVIGMGTYDTVKYYQEKYGKKLSIIVIGPSGERLYLGAGICITSAEGYPSRLCARGGLGTVMGSKKIKAILIDSTGGGLKQFADSVVAKTIVREWNKEVADSPVAGRLKKNGTVGSIDAYNSVGIMPTNNFSGAQLPAEMLAALNAEGFEKFQETRPGGSNGNACQLGCPIKCSHTVCDKSGDYLTSGIEYETIGMIGSNLGIKDYAVIADMDRFCDDMGLDTIDFGAAIGVAMDAGYLTFGCHEDVYRVAEEVRKDTLFGRMIGNGAAVTGRTLDWHRVPTVKGQAMAAYDPRNVKGTGVSYATSPLGADHTAGNCTPGRTGYRPENLKPSGPHDPNGKASWSRDAQVMFSMVDSFGLCCFVGTNVVTAKHIAELLSAALGVDYTMQDVIDFSEEVIYREKEYNDRCGFGREADNVPEFFRIEPSKGFQTVFDVPQEELETLWQRPEKK